MRKAGEAKTQAVPKATGMEAGPPTSSWVPFSHRAFALLWTATLISNVGTWMHDVGAGWLMTTLSPSPAIVALVQAATTLPRSEEHPSDLQSLMRISSAVFCLKKKNNESTQ